VKSDAINIHSILVSFLFFLFTEPCSLFFSFLFCFETIDYPGGAAASGTVVLSFPLPRILDALVHIDSQLESGFADLQVTNSLHPLITRAYLFDYSFVEQVKM
jgi:hypothetical protein